MGENSKIEWTDHTFNPWTGCTKVSPACTHCYAEAWAKRSGIVKWGDAAERRRTSEANWRLPLKWDREAGQAGARRRVFCASLADVFEDRPELIEWRKDLFALIEGTPNLDWLLLTKRPENIARFSEGMPQTVWLGTTVENDEYRKRVVDLSDNRSRASVLFLSCEPLLGPLDLSIEYLRVKMGGVYPFRLPRKHRTSLLHFIDWVICGGESGGGSRPMNPEWVYELRDQCKDANVPFHFKQWGDWFPRDQWEYNPYLCLPDDSDAYTDDETTKVFKNPFNEYFPVHRVGKKQAGRVMDGRTWDEFPKPKVIAA